MAPVGLAGFTLATIVGTRHAEPALLGAAVACIPVVLAIMAPLAQRQRPSLQLVTALGFALWFTGVQRMGAGTAG